MLPEFYFERLGNIAGRSFDKDDSFGGKLVRYVQPIVLGKLTNQIDVHRVGPVFCRVLLMGYVHTLLIGGKGRFSSQPDQHIDRFGGGDQVEDVGSGSAFAIASRKRNELVERVWHW